MRTLALAAAVGCTAATAFAQNSAPPVWSAATRLDAIASTRSSTLTLDVYLDTGEEFILAADPTNHEYMFSVDAWGGDWFGPISVDDDGTATVSDDGLTLNLACANTSDLMLTISGNDMVPARFWVGNGPEPVPKDPETGLYCVCSGN